MSHSSGNFKSATDLQRIQRVEDMKDCNIKSVQEIGEMFKAQLEGWKDVEVNIAVTGSSGTGKSSFINVIRGFTLNDWEKGAAKTGLIDTTRDVAAYPHPTNDKINFWDLPGIGTPYYPDLATYYKKLGLEKYDTFLIFTATRFTKNDLNLAKKVKSINKSVLFVRTKIDQDYVNEKPKKSFNEEAMLQTIMADSLINLEGLGDGDEVVFLISNHHPTKWDFARLTQAILNILPLRQIEYVTYHKMSHSSGNFKIKDCDIKNKSVQEIEEMFTAQLEGWKDVKINIAVTGSSGAGKSSFINVIRGLKDDDKLAAKTGIKECTIKVADYPHPTNDKINFCDLPGIGTPNYPDLATYCKKVGLEKYDTFLIFTATRFTKNDLNLAKKVKSINKSFFFIRTKIDQDYANEKRKKSFNEEAMLRTIMADCLKNLEGLGNEAFLISNHHPKKWEFNRLTKAILNALPYIQRESLTLSLTSFSKDLLKRKAQLLRDRIWRVAAASAAAALVPLPGLSVAVDATLLRNEANLYKAQLGLPDENTVEFSRMSPEIKSKIRMLCFVTAQQLARLFKKYAPVAAVEEFARFTPLVGPAIAGMISFCTTYSFLNQYLNDMEETALSHFDELKNSYLTSNSKDMSKSRAEILAEDELNPASEFNSCMSRQAKMLMDGTHNSEDVPPRLPSFTGEKIGESNAKEATHNSATCSALTSSSCEQQPQPQRYLGDKTTVVDAERKVRMRSALIQQLKDLKDLEDCGFLTTEQIQQQRAKVLEELSSL